MNSIVMNESNEMVTKLLLSGINHGVNIGPGTNKKAGPRSTISHLKPENSTDFSGIHRNTFWRPEVADENNIIGNDGNTMVNFIERQLGYRQIVTLKCACDYM